MTVAELIEKLKAMPQDLQVHTEGCDCTAEAGNPEEWERSEESVVMIRRGESDIV